MKLRLPLPLLFCAAAAAAGLPRALADDGAGSGKLVRDPSVTYKMPELRRDPSPVGDGKLAVITSYADVVEPVEKEVVSIDSTRTIHERIEANPLLRQFFGDIPDQDHESKEMGLGSGVIVSADGYILTNNHVVADADELTVVMSNGTKFPAKLVAADPKTDIAVVKISATGLPAATFADSDKLRVGDVVFAVGNPLGVGETVTMGIVSAKSRSVGILEDVKGYEDYIQTDAAINMGNSGGALVDAKGRFIGINSAIVSPSRGNIGIGFAIPVNMAVGIMKSLIETGTVSRGYLGVGGDALSPEIAEQVKLPVDAKGVIISQVETGGPAQRAGLQVGDVIGAVNGKVVGNQDELRLTISQLTPGSAVSLSVSRDGKPLAIKVVLGTNADKPNELLPGVEVGKLSEDVRRHLGIDTRITGLVVTKVDQKSDNAQDLPEGAVIVEINRQPVEDVIQAKELVHPGHNLFLVYFQGYQRYVVVNK